MRRIASHTRCEIGREAIAKAKGDKRMIEPITDRDIPYGMERCSCCDGFAGHTVGA